VAKDDSSGHGRSPRRKTRQDDGTPASPSDGPSLREFPIHLTDVLLFDLNVTRYAERAENYLAQGGNVEIEQLFPLILGERLEVGIHVSTQVPDAQSPAFTISATVNGVFVIDPGTDPTLVEAFAKATGLQLIWPFARELFQSISTRMRVWPIMLPTLDARPASETAGGAAHSDEGQTRATGSNEE